MPCKQCDNENYQWGEKGECEYDSKEACEKANTKYKEMKTMPTPLGKKTYEEYAKELKEFHKVQEVNLSAERIELKDAKTLDKLASKADGIITAIAKAKSKFDKQKSEANKSLKYMQTTEKNLEKARKTFDKQMNTAEENFYDAQEKAEKNRLEEKKEIEKTYKEISGESVDADKEFSIERNKLYDIHTAFSNESTNGDMLWGDFKQEYDAFENNLKNLGVSAPAKLKEYKDVLARLGKSVDTYEDQSSYNNITSATT